MNSHRCPALRRALFYVLAWCCMATTFAQTSEQFFGTGFPIYSEKLADGNLLHVAYAGEKLINLISDENGQFIAQTGEMGSYPDGPPQVNKSADGSFVLLSGNRITKFSLQGAEQSSIDISRLSARYDFKNNYGVAEALNSRGFVLVGEERVSKIPTLLFVNINGDLNFNIPFTSALPSSQLRAAKVTSNSDFGFIVEMVHSDGGQDAYSIAQINPEGNLLWVNTNVRSTTHSIDLQHLTTSSSGPLVTINFTEKVDATSGFTQVLSFATNGVQNFTKNFPEGNQSNGQWTTGLAATHAVDGSKIVVIEKNRNANTSVDAVGVYYYGLNERGQVTWDAFEKGKTVNQISTPHQIPNIFQTTDGCFSVVGSKNNQLWVFQPPTPSCSPTSTDSIDLTVRLTADNRNPGIYSDVKIIFSIANTGGGVAHDVLANFEIPDELAVVGLEIPKGHYNNFTGEWRIPSIEPNELVELELDLYTLTVDPIQLFGQVMVTNSPDLDSKPGNNTTKIPAEDDEASLILNPSAGVPDLYLENATPLNKFYADSTTTITFDVLNQGTAPVFGEYKIGFFLSTDNFLDDSDREIGSMMASSTPIGIIGGLMSEVKLPQGIMPGGYFLILKADSDNTLQELNEGNNILTKNILVEARPPVFVNQPDLEVSIVGAANVFDVYVPYDVTVTLTNAGGRPANDIILAFPFPIETAYVESTVSTGDFNNILKHWNIPHIAPQQSQTLTVTIFPLDDSRPIPLFAQVTQGFPEDYDSTPGNAECCTAQEDDEAVITIIPSTLNFRTSAPMEALSIKSLSVLNTFPNPTIENLKVTAFSNLEIIEYLIVNAQGKVVQSGQVSGKNLQTWTFSLSDLKGGFYNLLFRTNAKIEKVPFVKMEP